MNQSGKINPKLPFFILDKLRSDSVTFGLKENTIFNLIYSNLRFNFNNSKIEINGKYDEKKALSLNKEHRQEYIDVFQREINKNYRIDESEFFRNLLYQYSIMPIFERERVLYSRNFKGLNESINKNRCVILYSKKGTRKFEPYFIKQAEEFSYLFGYCLKRNEYRVFRISNIVKISQINEMVKNRNESEVVAFRENFDPFLSFGKKVKVRLTENGVKKYNTIISNRPKLLKNNGYEYEFECSLKKAEVYFPQFFTDVEILEPIELRNWYKDMLEKALQNYK